MKTFRMIGTAVVAAVFAFAMSSCEKDNKDESKDYPQLIVGKWFCFTPESSIFMNYQADGSFYEVGYGAKNGWREYVGTYEINGNKVRYGFKGDTNLYVNQVTKVCDKNGKFYGHYIARIYGGLNGSGEWHKYFKDFARLFIMIKNDEYFNRAILCEIDADCADDVFTCYISFTLKKDSKQ